MTRRQLKIAYAMALATWGAAVLIWFALNQLRVRLYDSAIQEPESLYRVTLSYGNSSSIPTDLSDRHPYSPFGTCLNLRTRSFDCEAPLTLIF